jgi:hypothetical protein
MNNKRLRPNIVRGGVAIPIPNKNNYYYMKGRKHEQGGIDIGKDPCTGLEVEDGEVMHISPTEVKVFSAVPFLNGESPAEKVIKGNNPNKVFNAQERYKDVNNINDDGTKKKAEYGILDDIKHYYNITKHNINAGINYIKRKINDKEKPKATIIRLNNVSRITPKDNNVESILFNDFVENNPNNIRKAKNFKVTNLIYNRGSGRTAREYFNPEDKKYVPMQKAILRGTDDEVREEINKIYKEADLANRDSLVNDFYKKRNKKLMGGLSRSKDYGSKSKPYPKVDKKDFAGKNRSYPIPTKADAIDALRLAGLHGRNDIKAKVYSKYPELRKRAKNGGVYTVTSNGKTSLRMIPSTGKRIEFRIGGTKKTEIPITLDPTFYTLGLEDELTNKINQPIVNYHTPVEEIKYDILDTKGRFNPITGVDLNTKRDYDNRNNIMKKRGYNSLISDGIGIASNIVGSIIGFNANKKALDKMKYTKAPVNLIPSKLKTNININPQLDAIRDQQQAYERQIDANTASSRVALGRKQLSRLNTIKLLNNIYTNKENTETELINKDKLNQQAVVNQNITNYNTWKEKKNAFENAIIEKQSENTIGLINSINAGVQNSIGNFKKRLAAENNIRAIAAANPNVNPIILKALGVRGITNDMIESWLRAYGNKNS